MQLSTKGRYAVMAMTELAGTELAGSDRSRREPGHAVTLAAIAERQQISRAYLEQLFARLRRQGLVRSVRGPGGGYRLARPAAELSVADVVTAVDEPLRATRCQGEGPGCMHGGARCRTHDLWVETGRQVRDYLAGISLADVLAGRLRPGGGAASP
jgi:Rrf2 family iron-sulfur cluster assembly transcriptional regulator